MKLDYDDIQRRADVAHGPSDSAYGVTNEEVYNLVDRVRALEAALRKAREYVFEDWSTREDAERQDEIGENARGVVANTERLGAHIDALLDDKDDRSRGAQ